MVILFAPRLLPPLARLLGHLLTLEARRRLSRYGIPLDARPPSVTRPRPAEPQIEILPPERPQPTYRAASPTPLSDAPPPSSLKSAWWMLAVVSGAVAVLLWYLLRTQ
jgi:hypothetical protein